MNTLLVAQDTWDLILDANRNIAVAAAPYAHAQDVASACKQFAGELWYDTTTGIPYFQNVLGETPPLQYVKAQMEKAALTVPGIVSAACAFVSFQARALSGQVRVTDENGVSTDVNF